MGHKAKMKRKNKVVPCADANTRAKERIALQNHKKEVIRKKIEKMMQEERARRMAMDTGATSTATVNTDKKDDTSSKTI